MDKKNGIFSGDIDGKGRADEGVNVAADLELLHPDLYWFGIEHGGYDTPLGINVERSIGDTVVSRNVLLLTRLDGINIHYKGDEAMLNVSTPSLSVTLHYDNHVDAERDGATILAARMRAPR